MQKKHKKLLMLLTFILVVTSTIAYSALTSTLQIDAEAKLRTVSDIRVTGISLSSSSGATLQYESSYDVDSITSGFILPTTESSITYKVTVANNGTIDQTIYDILTQSSNNSGLYYTISGYNVKDVIGFKSVIEFYITYKTTTPSNDPINVVNRFNFKEVYHITFETKGGSNIPEAIKYEGVDLDLSSFTSTKQGYILSGWTDEQDGTTVKYQTDGTYTLDRDLILYALWTSDPNTSYTVNHYVHDLGTNTYTLNSTDNLTGETDSTVTLANLKKTIPGFTYVDGYLTGGTTKPTEGAVTTTTILADGSRVINLYYRRNYLYVQYHVNGGQLAEQHHSGITVINDLIAGNNKTTFLRGVYGSKVGDVNTTTYEIASNGLHNYNSPTAINIEKNGYIGKSGQEWNTSSDGTGTSYGQDVATYNANGFGGADLSTGNQVVTLYVNWVPVDYEIMYDLQGGVLYNTTNPATYNIETNTITLNNPTKIGYTFLGWTGSNGNTPETTVTIPTGSTGDKAYIANWQVNNYNLTLNANGGTIGSNKLFSFDGSTHTIDGTIVGATWGDDYLQFAGNDSSYVNLGEINSDYMTLQATFSVDEVPTETKVIIGNIENGGGLIGLREKNGQYVIFGQYYNSDGYQTINSDVIVELGKKYNVLFSYNGTTERLYIDNVLIGEINISGTITLPQNNTIMALGGNPGRNRITGNYFKGKIYNASVYSNPKKQVTYGQTYNDLPTPTRDGYTFKGWYTDLSGTSDYVNYGREYMYQDKISIHTSAYMDNWSTFGNKTIFSSTQSGGLSLFNSSGYVTYSAYDNGVGYKRVISTTKWADLSKGWHDFDLVFDGEYIYGYIDGSSVGTSEKFASGKIKYHTTNSMFFGDEATASPTTPSGSNFVGNIGNTIIKNNSNLISGTTYNTITTPAQDLTLYAIWEPINYEIMYDLQGGVLYNTTNPTTYNPDTNTITLNNPTKIGYTFLGWTGSNGNTPETTVTIPIGSTGDKAYIANWQVNNYTLTFDANGGNVSTTTKSVQYGQTYNDLPTPTREGYTFRGWYKTFDGTNDYINMGREYMYEDKISVHTSAYMDDWSTFSSVIFSSTQTGGWNIDKKGSTGQIEFNVYDSEVGNKVFLGETYASLLPGWHDFDLVFDGEYAYGYVDGKLSGKSAKFTSGNIGYNPTNSIFIGGEATNSPTAPNTYRFTGNLGNIIIKNSDKLISRTTYNTITAPAQDLTLYAKWDSNATFLPGSEFNAKIKQLAGNSNATYATTDTNITTIVRYPGIPTSTMLSNAEIVSTTDSTTPIYAWFDNGVIYYYTESEYPYMNSDASNMFYELSNVIAIDVSTIDTSRTTNMSGVFYNNNKLKTLDLSNFDMSGVTSTTDMLSSMTSLESLKTPSIYPTNTSVNITLPSTLYTQDGTGYSAIDSTSPTETWLYKMICKRATTLHTEQCSQTSKTLYCSASGYQVGGSKNTTTITYGNFGTDNTSLNGGDAFTCDVNGDGIYNEETERFYYVSDYYNTQTKSFETDTGVLVYYNNVSAGVPNNTDIFTYDDTDNLHGPRSATQQLPTTNQWSNVSLKNTERAILNYQNGNTAGSEQLPSNYSYLGHSARLLTQQEINSSVGKAITSFGEQTAGLDLLAPHYFENTRYSNNNLNASWWLEGTTVGATTHAIRIMTTISTQYGNGIYSISVENSLGVRPAIEVDKHFLNKKVYSYLITYDTNGGSENTTQTISVGNSLSTLPTNPTRRGYSFDGWYTAKTGGTQITTSTVPTTNTTYYAHWTPNTYTLTFNANGGNVSTTTKSVEYGTTYNDLPTPTRAGYTFKGWYQTYNGTSDYTSYGRDYMYKDKISIHASAYMEDWSNAKTLLSSTEAGGWSINNDTGNIKFYIYDENVGYKSVPLDSLSPGWHDFDLVFDGEYAYGYLDGTKITTSAKLTSGSIGYHGFNQILIGSEPRADGSPTLAQCFDGNIGNVVIKNDDTLIPSTTYNTITAPAQNATLYARWEPINYEITYDLQGGTLSTANPTTYNAETETFTLNNPTKTGYMFVGWTGSNGLIPETTVTIPKGSYKDKAYIANWNEIYTITLNPNGGSVNPTTIDILEGNSLGILPTPTKTDFEFIGWYTDVSGTLVDSSTVPTASATLIAHYEPSITKGAIYSANGGKFNSDKSVNVVEYDEDSETPLQTITKYSHTSNIDDTGLKSSNYGGNWNNTNIRGTDRTTSSSEAHVITIPGASELTVDLYYNGESVSWDWVSVWAGSYPSYTASNNATSTGYVTTAMGAPNNNNRFGGSQSGSYTVNENSLTNMGYTRLTIPGDSVTFSFKSDSGGSGQGYGYYAIVSGTARGNTENYEMPTRTGYTFNNWNTTSDASGTRYISEQDIIDYVNNNNTALRLYAEWIPKTYTIALNPNGATNTPTSSLTATYDSSALSPSSITVPEKVYTTTINTTLDPNRNSDGATITGDTTPKSRIYTFDGWRTSSSGGTIVINNSVTPTLIPSTSGYTDSNGNWVKDENITLYAKWIDPEVTTVTLPKITKAGFKCGWTNVSTSDKIATINNTKLDSEATFNPGDNNYTLYPVCELDKYFELTYDANDGYFGYPVTTSPTTTNIVTYTKNGNTVTAYADGVKYREYKKPIRDGYRFDGWSTSKTATTPTYTDEDAAKAIVQTTGSATLYAVWTRVWAENLSYDNTNTGVNCSDAQCMLDYLATRLTNKGTTKFKVGDYIQMTPQNSTYTTIPKYTGYAITATINPKELNLWRVIRVNSNGTYDAVSEYASSVSPYFQGTLGYQNFVGYLNKIASQYENPRYTVGSRYMGYNGQTEFITDTSYFDGTSTKAGSEWTISTSGTPAEEYLGRGDSLYQTDYDLVKAAYGGASDSVKVNRVGTTTSIPYWIGSRHYLMNSVSAFGFLSRNVFASGGININKMYEYSSGSWNSGASGYALRPIIILRSGLTATGTGTKNDPYMLN